MPSELTKTYVPSFDEFVEDPDKWLGQLDGYNNPDAQGEIPQAQSQVTNEDENAAAPGDVQMGNAQPIVPGSEAAATAGSDNGWGPEGGAQPVGGQMAQDTSGGFGAQTPVQGVQPGAQPAPGAQGVQPVPGAQPVPPAQPGAQPAPGTQPVPPAQPAPAQEEDPNKQTPPAPAATGF